MISPPIFHLTKCLIKKMHFNALSEIANNSSYYWHHHHHQPHLGMHLHHEGPTEANRGDTSATRRSNGRESNPTLPHTFDQMSLFDRLQSALFAELKPCRPGCWCRLKRISNKSHDGFSEAAQVSENPVGVYICCITSIGQKRSTVSLNMYFFFFLFYRLLHNFCFSRIREHQPKDSEDF